MIRFINIINLLKISNLKKKKFIIVVNKNYFNLLFLLESVGYIKNYYYYNNKIILILNNKKKIKLLYKLSVKKEIDYINLKKYFLKINNLNFIFYKKKFFFTHSDLIKNKIKGLLVFCIYN